MMRCLLVAALGLVAASAEAEEHARFFQFGGDTFHAGRSVTHEDEGTDDLFMAGADVIVKTDIAGSAHLAGRDIILEGAVGRDVYAAGEEVRLLGDVSGDATIAGREVTISDVGGDVRAAGSELRLSGQIGGYAIIAGEDVAFEAVVAGDVSLTAQEVNWGDTATIAGRLVIFEETPGELQVPEWVVSADRIERREIEDWEGPRPPNWGQAVAGFLLGVILVAALAALIAALVPERLAEIRRLVLQRPFHALWLGFLTQSAVIGSGVLFAMTIIGLLMTPTVILLALVGGFAGYVVAAYAFGVGLLLAFGRPEPDSIGDRALAAAVGALVAGIIGLIPFLGWIFVLVLVLAGIGGITIRVVRPAFFTGSG